MVKNIIKKFNFLLILLIAKISYIICADDCSECEIDDDNKICASCDLECKYYNKESNCIYCGGISTSSIKYYKITSSEVDGTIINTCTIISNNEDIIPFKYDGTYELGECGEGYYSLGDICYKGTADNTILKQKEGGGNNEYECQFTYSIETKDQLKYYTCYTEDVKCNNKFKYYDGDTLQCLLNPPTSTKKIKKEINGEKTILRYTEECIGNEFTFEEKDSSNTVINTYCVDECPNIAKYHYTNEKLCVERCKSEEKEFSDGRECIRETDTWEKTNLIKVDTYKDIFTTLSDTQTTCPIDYSFYYEKSSKTYCLKFCKDSNILFFDNDETYYLEENGKKTCQSDPSTESIIYYKDKQALKWVTDCTTKLSGPYFNGESKTCQSSCDKYIRYDNLECVEECRETYSYLDGNICYNSCPKNNERGFYKTDEEGNKICQSCSKDDGFFKAGDDECHDSCIIDSETYNYNFDQNECYKNDNGCKDNSEYKYTYSETNICYKSCLDINKDNPYRFEKEFMCYQTDEGLNNDNEYYFYTLKGITKYIKSDESLNECFEAGLKYLKGNECVDETICNKYKVLPTKNSFGYCFETYSECYENHYIYYNNSKICSTECKILKVKFETEEIPEETCVNICPTGFYENSNEKECVKKCPSSLFTDTSLSKCVSKCDSGFYKIKSDDTEVKLCVDKCSKEITEEDNTVEINIYYLEDGKCVDECNSNEGNTLLFSYDNSISPQPCINECPKNKPYTYDGKNICYEECKFYENGYCVDSCTNDYIHPGNICSSDTCPKSAPFFYLENESTQPKKICLSNCAEKNFKYFIVENNECTNICEGYIYNGGCYSRCPDGLYHENKTVRGLIEKICSLKCGEGKKFYKDDDEKYNCVDDCNQIENETGNPTHEYITTSNECVKICPNGENYINDNNQCSNKCENSEYFYEESQTIEGDNPYIIYECKQACNNEPKLYHIYGQKECIEACNELYEYETDHTCFYSCINNKNANYSLMKEESTEATLKNKCIPSCIELGKYYGSDNVCRSDCSVYANNKTINESDNRCVSQCDLKSKYKFLQAKENGENKPLFCREKCHPTDENSNPLSIRYSISNYICVEKCEAPNNYVIEDENSEFANQCRNECPDNTYYIRENEKGEFICSTKKCEEDDEGGYTKYYMNTNICLKECGKLYSYHYNSKDYCVTSCDFFKDKKLYHDNEESVEGDSTTYNYRCVETCDNEERHFAKLDGFCSNEGCENSFYFDSDKICLLKCPKNSTTEEGGNICKKCTDFSPKKFIDENGNCVDDCSTSTTGYIYHNKINSDDTSEENNDDNYVCLNSCKNKKIEGNLCVDSCTGDYPYNNDNICVDVCPFTKRFFLPEETEKKCLNDCPSNKKYYTIEEEGEPKKTFYQCQENCRAYVPNIYDNFNATFCFKEEKCLNDYKFYELDEYNNKKCLSQCPSDKSFYKEGITEDIECYGKCPDNLIHFADSTICLDISKCTSKNIRLKDRECVESCSKNEKTFTADDGITYCVNNCSQSALPSSITNFGSDLYLTYENKCLKNCPDGSQDLNNNFECICNNLFYIDKATLFKHCLTVNKCESDYPINIVGTKECTDYCDGILTVSEKECYPNNYTCNLDTEQKILLTNGKYRCECKDKYNYEYDNDGNKFKKCLPQNENCPSPYIHLIPDTKECIEECPETTYNIKFGETCLSKCPPLTEKNEDTNTCECSYKYYISQDNTKVCLEENKNCPEEYSLMTDEDSKKCIKKCPDSQTLDYKNKKCIDDNSCDDSTESKSTEGDPIAQQYASKKCQCRNKWYYDPSTLEEICDTEGTNDCSTLTNSKYNYFIATTNQCVKSCSGVYKFIFGNQCFKSCEEASTLTNIDLENDGENKCKCKEFSKYDDSTQCFSSVDDCLNYDYSIIDDATNNIKQCFEKKGGKNCPKEYPAYINSYCYKEENCPENANYNKFIQSCDCKNLWFEENSKITCLPSTLTSCSSTDYPLLISPTRQCIKSDNPEKENYFEFNSVLYLSCPKDTIAKEDTKKCICNNQKKWYSSQTSDGRTIIECDQEECPEEKPYIDGEGDSTECLDTCGSKKIYRKICYTECPYLTEPGNNNECILKQVNDELDLSDLEEVMTNNLLDLYNSNEGGKNATSSQKIVTKNATVEFYGVSIKNKGNSEQNIQSDLSYIDISECIEKIYSSNGMNSDENIIILKFDKNDGLEKNFLINPVEYKFINSRTGEKLDASVCQHNSIKISYPLHDLINKFDNLMRRKRGLDYVQIDLTSNNKDSIREKLDKGKEINSKYSYVDIFNINDNIYSDICFAVEIDGKDLVLKDRVNYFYPQMSLCENNCTYNHTDFFNERIYCDCSYKNEFDFNREYFPTLDINYEKIKNDQGGNSNIEVIKCISNLKNTKSLSGNYGFIFILIILIIELILLLVMIFYEIGSLLNKLKDKMKIEDSKENEDKVEVKVVNISSSDKKEKDSQRSLNAPPRKREEFGMEFIPQEYLFLFFNQNEKGVIKKVERDGVPFKTKLNTRILLEKIKGVNYDNLKARGPFPENQNILVIVDNLNDSLSDYLYDEDEENEDKIKNTEGNNLNKKYESLSQKLHKKSKKYSEKDNEISEKFEQKPKLYKKREKKEYTISDYDPSDENYSEIYFDEEDEDNIGKEKGFIESIKKEQRLLKKNYEISLQNKNSSNFVTTLLTEIIDKIYITKILLFTRKFDILSFQLSAYFLCHTLLLILLALFYDIEKIEKIWNKEDYPGLGYYLLYGFISCIVIWIIYTIILCLWSNNDKIKDLLRLIHGAKKYGVNKNRDINTKYKNLVYKIKFKVIIYAIIEFLLLAFCFIYFVTFCTVYTGTMGKVFKSYGIALIEVLIIKIIYGIVLAILRKVSLDKGKKTLYNVVLFMNTYLV